MLRLLIHSVLVVAVASSVSPTLARFRKGPILLGKAPEKIEGRLFFDFNANEFGQTVQNEGINVYNQLYPDIVSTGTSFLEFLRATSPDAIIRRIAGAVNNDRPAQGITASIPQAAEGIRNVNTRLTANPQPQESVRVTNPTSTGIYGTAQTSNIAQNSVKSQFSADEDNENEIRVDLSSVAVAQFQGKISGTLYFMETSGVSSRKVNGILINGEVSGLSPGEYAIIIHQSGDVSNNCQELGDRFPSLDTNPGYLVYKNGELRETFSIVQANSRGAAKVFMREDFSVSDLYGRSVAIWNRHRNIVACAAIVRK